MVTLVRVGNTVVQNSKRKTKEKKATKLASSFAILGRSSQRNVGLSEPSPPGRIYPSQSQTPEQNTRVHNPHKQRAEHPKAKDAARAPNWPGRSTPPRRRQLRPQRAIRDRMLPRDEGRQRRVLERGNKQLPNTRRHGSSQRAAGEGTPRRKSSGGRGVRAVPTKEAALSTCNNNGPGAGEPGGSGSFEGRPLQEPNNGARRGHNTCRTVNARGTGWNTVRGTGRSAACARARRDADVRVAGPRCVHPSVSFRGRVCIRDADSFTVGNNKKKKNSWSMLRPFDAIPYVTRIFKQLLFLI